MKRQQEAQPWPERPYTVERPLYLASAETECWNCHATITVVCLVAGSVAGMAGETVPFSEVASLPEGIVAFIQARFPSYTYLEKKGAYGNICPQCHSLSGDFFLLSEPGAPFFPMSQDDARRITLKEIPLSGPITVDGTAGWGTGELIKEHAKKVGSVCLS